MVAAEETSNGGADHVVELVSSSNAAVEESLAEEAIPLLTEQEKPKINIFTLSYSRRKPREQVIEEVDLEVTFLTRIISWLWSGSKYSGFICMALSSVFYFIMAVVSEAFSVQSIPLFESIFIRCIIISIASFVWLRRTGQPVFGPRHARSLLISRALVGHLSLFCFVYSIRWLPLSEATILNFTTPIMASMASRIFLQEKFELEDAGGQVCSFIGLIFISPPALIMQGSVKAWDSDSTKFDRGSHTIYAVLVGLFSSITGGISYCLIRAGAKASDQAVVTVLYFSLMASPVAAICAFTLENVVLPYFYSFLLMVALGLLAFFAEVLMARGLQLEKTGRVVNICYIEPFLLKICSIGGIGFSVVAPTLGGLFGCLIILFSVCSTIYLGAEKEEMD